MINVKGVSLDPFGNPCAKEKIRFTCVSSTFVHKGCQAEITTSTEGAYTATLNNGVYLIEVYHLSLGEYITQGTVEVTDDTTSPIDIPTLVQDFPYIVPDKEEVPA